MAYCTQCGHPTEGDNKFCRHCGAPSAQPHDTANYAVLSPISEGEQLAERSTRPRSPWLIVGIVAMAVVTVMALAVAIVVRSGEDSSPCVEKVEAWTRRIDYLDARLPDAEAVLDQTTYNIVKDAVTQEILNDFASPDDGLSEGTQDLIKEQCELYG